MIGDTLLYVGDLRMGCTSLSRLEGLEVCSGRRIERFDTFEVCRHENRWINLLGHRLYCTPGVIRANRELLNCVRQKVPSLVWVDKGRWLFPWTLRQVRKMGLQLLHYNTDDVFGGEGELWLHRLGLRYYHCAMTTNRHNVIEVRRKYGIPTFRTCMGYDERLHARSRKQTESESDVTFVGHYEPYTEGLVSALLTGGLQVALHGHRWGRARNHVLRMAKPLPQAAYRDVIGSAKLALCVLSRRNRNESTGRSFEIPAIGACLIAPATSEHQFLYQHGHNAFLYRDSSDLVAQCRNLRANRAQRDAVANAGHDRCTALQLSWQALIGREWKIALATLKDPARPLAEEDDLPMWHGFRRGEPFSEENNGEVTT